MAAGDQTWDPSLEDKMVRWTSAASEKEIDRAARQLGGECQFRKKKKQRQQPSTAAAAPLEAHVRVHRGGAARIDARPEGRGDAGRGRLPGVGANRRDVDGDEPQIVLPQDAVATAERRALEARGIPSLDWLAPPAEPLGQLSRTTVSFHSFCERFVPGPPGEAPGTPPVPPREI